MSESKPGRIERFPALKCRVGEKWIYYLTAMPFSEVADRVKRQPRNVDNRLLKRLLQRELSKERLSKISHYLGTQPERFFNAIVVAVEGGDPQWLPLELTKDGEYGPLDIDMSVFDDFLGVLELDRTERMFTVDGQHRVEGIRLALNDYPELADEMIPVVFVAHLPTEMGMRRTRRLFSTLNRYAKRVSPGDIVQLDEDDGYAIAVREVVRDHPALSKFGELDSGELLWMVDPATSAQLAQNNQHSFTSIVALYNQSKILYSARGTDRTKLGTERPDDAKIADIAQVVGGFWTAVGDSFEEVNAVFESTPGDGTIAKYRNADGGHLLLRPVGQQALCEAVRVMMFRRVGLEAALAKLSSVPMDLNSPPWRGYVWDGTAMSAGDQRLTRNLLLHMVGEPPDAPPGKKGIGYSVEGSYQRITNSPDASLKDLVKFKKVARRGVPKGING